MLIRFSAPATVVDENGDPVTSVDVLRSLDGAKCLEAFTDYLGGGRKEATAVALLIEPGGYLQFVFDNVGNSLKAVTEYRAARRLGDSELQVLIGYTSGQWSDGIGENFTGDLSESYGYSAEPDWNKIQATQIDDGIPAVGNRAAAIFRAIEADDINAVISAIPGCTDVNARVARCTPLAWAILYERPAIAVELARHCDVRVRDVLGDTLLDTVALSKMNDDDSARIAQAIIQAATGARAFDDHARAHAALYAQNRGKSKLERLLLTRT